MKFFRNPEIIRVLALQGLLSAAATAAAFSRSFSFGVFTLVLCAAFVFIFLLCTYSRYRRIYQLSAEIDRLLHGEDAAIALKRYSEGELGVLQSEIHKMTIRLREQKQHLMDDKVYLADSIADISHQIRTPLTSMNLLVQLLCKEDIPQERRRKLLYEILGLLSRIDWLITALLKLSRLDAGTVQFQKETMPLSKLIDRAAEPLLVPMELREQKLKVSTQGCFTGDLAWTSEAVGNIVKNCMEHTPNGGEIEICAGENALYTQICISDSGSGIAKEDLPHVFERFYKGKNSDEKSFGIGLALSRMIVTSQNGTVKVENLPGKGAKFTLRFYKSTI